MKKVINSTHLEGVLYEHDLQKKESGPNSKNPGTVFISGTVSIATDNALTNVVPVHFTYVTATTAKGTPNATFEVLSQIIDGKLQSVMDSSAETAAKLRIDSAIGLNDFYTDRNGEETLVSAKRNEGGFVHTTNTLEVDEAKRNTFEVDIIITNVRRIEADPENGREEKGVVKGAIFDYRKSLLPIEFSLTNPEAIDYFESLNPTSKTPVFTRVKGVQVSETIVKTISEPSAFGTPSVREIKNTRKDFVINWAQGDPYIWDDESTITAQELTEAMATRETYLATVKQRADEYKASKANGVNAITASSGATYNF